MKSQALRHCHVRIVAAGGIHQYGRDAERLFDRLMRGVEALHLQGIGGKEGRLAAFVLDGFNARQPAVLVAAHHRHLRAGLAKPLRNRTPQCTRPANDHSHLS